MIPFLVLVIGFILFQFLGYAGFSYFTSWRIDLHWAVSMMFFVTASAHWGKRRKDLIQMIPASIPKPAFIVTLTGIVEVIGAIALLVPITSLYAAFGLTVLLILIYPANIKASINKHQIGGIQTTSILPRTILQLIFISAILLPILPL